MPPKSAISWPILELLDRELEVPSKESAETGATAADAVFMTSCDAFVARDGRDSYVLTLKHDKGVTNLSLIADLDEDGKPILRAYVR